RRGACGQIGQRLLLPADAAMRGAWCGTQEGWRALIGKFVRSNTPLSQNCGVFAATLIAASVVIVCQMVFVRYVLNQTTIWQTDFVTFSIVAATFIGSPYLLLNRGHVNVDVLPLYLGQRGRYRLALASM